MKSTMILFPGQGSQSVAMLADVYQQYPQIKLTFEEANDVLNMDLWKFVMEGPAESLNSTEITQPAILAASIALWRLVSQSLSSPQFLAGHSLGEYSALVAANVIDFSEAIKLVHARGQFMQQSVAEGEGAMAAIIGLDDDAIIQACRQSEQNQVVSAVNFNSPGQVVIAGHKAAVERAMDACKQAGAKRAIALPVSVPSHCALMKPAAELLQQKIANIHFSPAQIPVINNVDVVVETDPEAIKRALIKQLYQPVRWADTISSANKQGVEQYFECGPGKVLTGLCKRIVKGSLCVSLSNPSEISNVLL